MDLAWPQAEKLIRAAREARRGAYAPYSKFKVGAALLASDGRLFPGVNVENSAYPICQCAERSALGAAVTAGARRFSAIAIVCPRAEDGSFGAPCGGCRQALSEFGLDLWVILAGPSGKAHEIVSLAQLLPHAFTPASL
ncbi:MAG: cytidine deaminase [Myxococcota bacterium]